MRANLTCAGLIALSGLGWCAGAAGAAGSHAAGVSIADAGALTVFIADTLAGSMDPGQSTLQLAPYSGPDNADMQVMLVDTLRERGFALSPDGMPYPGAHVVQYGVSPVGSDLALEIDVDDASATCLYQHDGDGRLRRLGACTLGAGSQLTLRTPAEDYLGKIVPTAAAPGPVRLSESAVAARLPGSTAPIPLLPVPLAPVTSQRLAPPAASRTGVAAAMAAPHVPLPPPPPPPAPEPVWQVAQGELIGKALEGWGARAGWSVFWRVGQDWSAPARAEFRGDFKGAASAVVKDLSDQGANIRSFFFDPNKSLVVCGPGDDQVCDSLQLTRR